MRLKATFRLGEGINFSVCRHLYNNQDRSKNIEILHALSAHNLKIEFSPLKEYSQYEILAKNFRICFQFWRENFFGQLQAKFFVDGRW